MRHALNSFLLPTLFSLIPCAVFDSSLLLRPEVWISWLGVSLMLFGQPPANLLVPVAKSMSSAKDRWSGPVVTWASFAISALAVGEFISDPLPLHPMYLALGLLSMTCGLLLRRVAIRTLGKFFTARLQVVQEQTLVTSGIFGSLRHPSYLGVILILIGPSILYQRPITALVSILILVAAYAYRIRIEESLLLERFGDIYRDYQARTKALIPYVY